MLFCLKLAPTSITIFLHAAYPLPTISRAPFSCNTLSSGYFFIPFAQAALTLLKPVGCCSPPYSPNFYIRSFKPARRFEQATRFTHHAIKSVKSHLLQNPSHESVLKNHDLAVRSYPLREAVTGRRS